MRAVRADDQTWNGEFERLLRDEIDAPARCSRRGAAGSAERAPRCAYLAACGTRRAGGGAAEGRATRSRSRRARSPSTLLLELAALHRLEKRHGAQDQFQKKYGTKVKYTEEINDNDQFFGKVRQQYAQGELGRARPPRRHRLDGGADEAARLRAEVRQVLDAEREPNIEPAASPDFDPKREFSVPWQSGHDGIIYRKDKVEEDAEVRQRPLRPEVQGQGHDAHRDARHGRLVTALAGRRAREGQPRPGDEGDRQDREGVQGRARSAVHRQRLHPGHPEGRLGRSSAGRATRCSSRPTTRTSSTCSRRGLHVFTDTMQIPVGAPHAFTAEKFMDFVYDPEIAGADRRRT